MENASEEKQNTSSKLHKLFTYERLRLSMAIFFGAIFLGTIIVGLTNSLHHFFSPAHARLVVTQNFPCLFVIFGPYFLEKFFGIRMDLKIIFSLYLFCVCGVLLGEAFQFYSKYRYWDKILHAISGVLQTYIAFGLIQAYLKNYDKNGKFWTTLVFAVLVSLGIAALWEMMEFATDLLNGSNAQKFIPLYEPQLDNGGDSRAPLNGTMEEIFEFYRYPAGYKYALMDTMLDIIYCFFSSLGFALIIVVTRIFKKDAFENCFELDPKYKLKKMKEKR